MAELSELREQQPNAVELNLNFGDLLGKAPPKVPDELTSVRTGLSNAESSLPGLLSEKYTEIWKEKPVLAGAATVGTTALGVAALRYLPATSTHMAGVYGATKLMLTDAPDLLSSNGTADYAKYGLACASDLAMVAGTAARYIPRYKGVATLITASGITGRLLANYLPDTEKEIKLNPSLLQTVPVSERFSLSVPNKLTSSETRSFDAFIPKGKESALPVVIMLAGVQDKSAPGMERETNMNRLAQERGFIAVYPEAKEKEQPMIGKVFDWNSPGAGLTKHNPDYDDVDYIKGVLDQVKQKANVDERAVYVVGFSSGGQFAQHLRGRLPGVFAGVGSIHGTVLGTEAKAQEKSAFISVHSDSDHMLPYGGGRGLMTVVLPTVAKSEPMQQMREAARINGLNIDNAKVKNYESIRITDYSSKGSPPVKEFYIEGGYRGGMIGGLIGRGRDGFPAAHSIDGDGAGGWPVVGDKNRNLDTTRLVVDELLKYRRGN
ncbi:MAG: dienelactone hydrolase family protein [Candidatus Obscuribacterales bacterium]|nr:dienelactone hydrolase family protein [Candidatus Obscuribacterales bacterium]